jgi:hypothetical protein
MTPRKASLVRDKGWFQTNGTYMKDGGRGTVRFNLGISLSSRELQSLLNIECLTHYLLKRSISMQVRHLGR